MKPNDVFRLEGNPLFVADMASLSLCYYPIIGRDGFALYHYLVSLSQKGPGSYKFSWLLNHLDLGMVPLGQALDLLSAMELLVLTGSEAGYGLYLKAPLTVQQFLDKPLYQNLLAKKIGDGAVDFLRPSLPQPGSKVSKQFSDVFSMEGEPLGPIRKEEFDWSAFRAMMAKDRLRFVDEKADLVAIYHLAEQSGWNWLETYRQVKATAVGNQVSIKRLAQKQEPKVVSDTDLTKQEQAIVAEAKSQAVLPFFQFLKEQRRSSLTASERQFIQGLAQLGLLDEVLNVLLLYVFNRVDSANLNEKFAQKVANDFLYKRIGSAEEAVLYLRTVKTEQRKQQEPQKTSNVPQWSQEEVRTEMTEEGRAKMAALRQQMLAGERKGGD